MILRVQAPWLGTTWHVMAEYSTRPLHWATRLGTIIPAQTQLQQGALNWCMAVVHAWCEARSKVNGLYPEEMLMNPQFRNSVQLPQSVPSAL